MCEHVLTLTLSQIDDIFLTFFQKIGLGISMQIVCKYNLHEMSNPIFWRKYSKMSAADFLLSNPKCQRK